MIFSITREEIELPVKIGDKNLNLTQPNGGNGDGDDESDNLVDRKHLDALATSWSR